MAPTTLKRRLTVEAKGDLAAEEEERKIIYEWNERRHKKHHGLRKSYQKFLVYTFNVGTIISFIRNFNFMVLIQMCLAGVAVYIFTTFDITFDVHVSLFVSPIVFPLAFSINTDFQRREKVLDDLANFKSAAMVWFFCMRDWKEAAGLDDQFLKTCHIKLKSMLFYLREYLLTERGDRRRAALLRALYEDFSDANQLIEKVRASKLPVNTSLMARVIHLLNTMCLSFERLRNVREYRSPRSIRAFNKVLIFFLPFILAPYFVFLGKKINNHWSPYYIAIMVSFIFGCLQGVQDKLDDPFDGMSEDDINLRSIDEWTFNSLEVTVNRTFKIGRFQVNIETGSDVKSRASSSALTVTTSRENLDSIPIISRHETFTDKDSHSSFRRRDSWRASKKTQLSKKKSFKEIGKSFFEKSIGRKTAPKTPPLNTREASLDQHPYLDVLEKMQGDDVIGRNGQVIPHSESNLSLKVPSSSSKLKNVFPDPTATKVNSSLDKPFETKIDMENTPTTKITTSHVDRQRQISFSDEQEPREKKVHPVLHTIHSGFSSEDNLSNLPLTTPLIKHEENSVNTGRFKLAQVGGQVHVTSSSSNSDVNLIGKSDHKKNGPFMRQSNSATNLRKSSDTVLFSNHTNKKNFRQNSLQDSKFYVKEKGRDNEVFI